MNRIVCQFSCGAASAVATKMALAQYGATHDVQIINAFVLEEHEDNRRFLIDCERWFQREITQLRDVKYGASIIRVFRERQYMKGPKGAPCTGQLKRKLLDGWKQPGDIIVFGYTAEEADRLDDFREQFPDREVLAPLVDAGLRKEDCKAMVLRAGIALPFMYTQGYDNANCIGCVKGGKDTGARSAKIIPNSSKRFALCRTKLGKVHGSFATGQAHVRASVSHCATFPPVSLGATKNCRLARFFVRWSNRIIQHEILRNQTATAMPLLLGMEWKTRQLVHAMKRTEMKRSGPIARSTTPKTTTKTQAPARRSTLKTKERARTPAEIELHDRLAALGCIACLKDGRFNDYVSIHHVDGRTKPGCHLLVLPLCAPHHQRDDTDPLHRIAVHPDQGRFEKRYGQQLALVAECMAMVEGRP